MHGRGVLVPGPAGSRSSARGGDYAAIMHSVRITPSGRPGPGTWRVGGTSPSSRGGGTRRPRRRTAAAASSPARRCMRASSWSTTARSGRAPCASSTARAASNHRRAPPAAVEGAEPGQREPGVGHREAEIGRQRLVPQRPLDDGEVVAAVQQPESLGDLAGRARVVRRPRGRQAQRADGPGEQGQRDVDMADAGLRRAPMPAIPALPQCRSGPGAIQGANASSVPTSPRRAPSPARPRRPGGAGAASPTGARRAARPAAATRERGGDGEPRATWQRACPARQYTAQASRPCASASSASRANSGTAAA